MDSPSLPRSPLGSESKALAGMGVRTHDLVWGLLVDLVA